MLQFQAVDISSLLPSTCRTRTELGAKSGSSGIAENPQIQGAASGFLDKVVADPYFQIQMTENDEIITFEVELYTY